jgi:carbamoyl-phosphate synthase large subunit
VSKATGVSLAKLATKVMLGHTLEELGFTEDVVPPYFAVKESVFPFRRFPGVDPMLGPEMRSTGEVMGIDVDFGLAYAKAQLAASQVLPISGGVLFSVKDPDKPMMAPLVKGFQDLGFQVYATRGTALCLGKHGVEVEEVYKIREARPNIIDRIKNREIALVINTPRGRHTPEDSYSIRRAALEYNIPYTTTHAAAKATLNAIRTLKEGKLEVKSLQEYHEMVGKSG